MRGSRSSLIRRAGAFLGVAAAIATVLVANDSPAGGTTVSTNVALTGVFVTPNQRCCDDPPANAIDGNLATATWSTESGNTIKPAYLEVSFASTPVNRLRLYKTADYGPHDLVIQYTTDTGDLSGRTWSNVSGLDNGFKGTEAMSINSINPATASITNDHHDSAASGYASLIFDTVTATGLRIAFSGYQENNHYRVHEFEVRYEAESPSFTSSATANFAVGSSGLFNVEATGFPSPIVTLQSGTLPSGLTFFPYNGTGAGGGSIQGTPDPGTGGTYPLTFKATNGNNPDATQNVTLNVSDSSTTTSGAQQITVVAPNGGESWAHGTAHTIAWTFAGFPTTARVKIELVRGATFTKLIKADRAIGKKGNGSLAWTVPNVAPRSNYAIRITVNGTAVSDTSNATFTIT